MAVKGVNFHIKGTNAAGPAMQQFQRQLQGVRAQTVALQPVSQSWNKGLSENRRAIQQLGFQMTDFSVQIAGGQNAMLAFIQQGGQMLQVFGPMGAIMAALLTVFGTLALVIGKSGVAMSEITPLLGVLESELWIFVEAFRMAFEGAIWVTNLLLNNLDVLATMGTIYVMRLAMAALFMSNTFRAIVVSFVIMRNAMILNFALMFNMTAAFGAMRLAVAGLATAQALLTLITWGLTAALNAAAAAMMRFLPFVVLAAVAWLIVKFIELIQLAGGFGNAMRLLGNLALAVFKFMGNAALGLVYVMLSGIDSMMSAFVSFFAWVMEQWEGMVNTMIDGWNAVMDAFGATGARADPFKSGWAEGAAESAKAFANTSAAWMDAAVSVWQEGADGVTEAWTAITDLFANQPEVDVRDWFGGGEGGGGGGGGGADKLKKEADKIKEIFEDVSKAIEDSLMTGFKAVIKGTMSLKEYAISVLDTILDKVIELLMQPIFAQIASGIANWLIGGLGLGMSGLGGGSGMASASKMAPTVEVASKMAAGAAASKSGGTVTVVIEESSSFASTVDARAQGIAIQTVRRGIAQYDRSVLPRSNARINSDPLAR